MAFIVPAIGLLAGALGIVQFTTDKFIPKGAPTDTKLRVAVGVDSTGGLDAAGGPEPDVWLYNTFGVEIGRTSAFWPFRGTIPAGSFADLTIGIYSQYGNQQSPYILVSPADSNAICVAYMTLTWPDGGQHGWTGDMGQYCGLPWYPSNMDIGTGYKVYITLTRSFLEPQH